MKNFLVFFKAQTPCGKKFLSSTRVDALNKEDAAARCVAELSASYCYEVTSVIGGY